MGILGHYADTVTLVNRTIGAEEFERDLNVRYDGEDLTLKPGENTGVPRVAAQFALNQNPLMGSANPLQATKYAVCLVGIKADPDHGVKGTDCTPISKVVLAKAAGKYEVLDRSGEFWDEPMQKAVLRRKKKAYDPSEARAVAFSEAPAGGGIE
jgi:hypothetical protein